MHIVSSISGSWQAILQNSNLLPADAAHLSVFIWPVATPVAPESWSLLDSEEQLRAQRFRFAHHREHFVAAHAGMRRLLAQISGRDAADLRLIADTNKKPQLADGALRFNLTHSGDWAALAVSRDAEVGIDIEEIRSVEPELPRRYFSLQEQADLAALAPSNTAWLDGFFRCWTRKEALLKAVGAGLTLPLDAFSVSLLPDASAELLASSLPALQPADWSLLSLDGIPNCMGAVAASSSAQSVSIFSINVDAATAGVRS